MSATSAVLFNLNSFVNICYYGHASFFLTAFKTSNPKVMPCPRKLALELRLAYQNLIYK
jgi:hypothetical protein